MSREIRPAGSFSILPPVIKNLIIINVIFFLLKLTLEKFGIDLDQILGLHYWESPYFRIWQPITHMFMHGGFSHILFNMFGLWMFGNTVENVLGTRKFLILYFVSGLGAAFCQMMVYHYQLQPLLALAHTYPDQYGAALTSLDSPINVTLIGASGAVFGIFLAFGYLFPNSLVYFYFLFPMKAKWVVLIFMGIELFSGVSNSVGDNVAHFAHVGGALFAFLLLYSWKKKGRLFL